MKILPLLISDSYKQSHHKLYPKGLQYLYSNMTARSSRVEGQKFVIVFGIRYFIKKYLIDGWKEFFERPIEDVLAEYKSVIVPHLGPDVIDDEKIKYLHSLGYLPLYIKALPEGTKCPLGVPMMTVVNTDKNCAWLTNFIETISQTILWKPITSATTAYRYRELLDKAAEETSSIPDFVDWQGHDFSMRGMDSLEGAVTSGMSHLLSFKGTDTIPAIVGATQYYAADPNKEIIGCSVTASEHSIQCSYFDETSEDEEAYINAMLDAVPSGIVSIVSDGYDYWKLVMETLPKLKDRIMERKGTVVIRPDTGDPVRIVSGYIVKPVNHIAKYVIENIHRPNKNLFDDCDCVYTYDKKYITFEGEEVTEHEAKGTIVLLDKIFGSSVNDKGYKQLHPSIGCIYGDSITYERAQAIVLRLQQKGYASTNVVFGIGSYTYQYVTRDTYGLAFKATWVQVDGQEKPIFKDPKTGDGKKKSAKGLLKVFRNDKGEIVLKDNCTADEEASGLLQTVFDDGQEFNIPTFAQIRERLKS